MFVLNSGFSGPGNQTVSFKFLLDPPLLPWQQADVIWTQNRPLLSLYHRLRGSASPVLTATHHSYGSPKLSDFFPAHAWRSGPQPILTQNGSNGVNSRKDVPFAVKIATFHTL